MPDRECVFIVLDRAYGNRLHDIQELGAVWIVDTPENRAAAEAAWRLQPERSHFDGVTTFKSNSNSSSEQILLEELDAIDLHHPACRILEVIGTPLTNSIRQELATLDFDNFEPTPNGFRAGRIRLVTGKT